MVTDKRALKAINGVKDANVKKVLSGSGSNLCNLKFFLEHESEFKKLLPTYYETFMRKSNLHYYSDNYKQADYIQVERADFMGYLFIELGIIDPDDFTTVVKFNEAGYENRSLAFFAPSSLLFLPGLKNGCFTDAELIDYVCAHREYAQYFMPLFCAYNSEKFANLMVSFVTSAGIEDTLRVYALKSMLTSSDAAQLLRFVKAIETNDFYRLRALKDASVIVGNYTAVLPAKELVKTVESAANGETDKWLNVDFRHAYHFIDTYLRVYKERRTELVKLILNRGGTRCRQALFFLLMREDDLNVTYLRDVFGGELSLEDLSFFFYRLSAKRMKREDLPLVFDKLFELCMSMEKVNYHYKTDDDISFARDVSKSYMMQYLGAIAAALGCKERIARLDGIYGTLREEAQAKYLESIGDKTSLDVRACAVRFLKTDDYFAVKFYDDLKIKLDYAEAVIVSDFLKSKKQDVKTKIVKEFLRSPDKNKIAEYLLSASEEYKKAAGEELQKSIGKVSEAKLEANTDKFTWCNDSIFNVDVPSAEIHKLTEYKIAPPEIKPMRFARFKAFTDAVSAFIDENRDYEYAPSYGDGLSTFGTRFVTVKGCNTWEGDYFSCFPLGDRLKKLYTDMLDKNELAYLSILEHCICDNGKGLFLSLYDDGDSKKIYDYVSKSKKSFAVDFYAVVNRLSRAVINELLDEDTLISTVYMFVGKKPLEYLKRINKDSPGFGAPSEFIGRLTGGNNASVGTVKTLAAAEAILLENNIIVSFAFALTARAYEFGIISDELARYLTLKKKYLGGVFYGDTKQNILRHSYPNKKFVKFMLDFMNYALDIEFKRGNLQTPYSEMLMRAGRTFGVDNYMRAISALRGITWVRSPYGFEKDDVLSAALKVNVAADGDTYEKFVESVKKYGITKDELIRATLFNPEYVDHAAKYLGIPKLKLAVYWFVAHLNETLEDDERSEREEKLKEFSDISYPDFQDGAFDCKWYEEMRSSVPEEELKRIYDNAKYVTVGGLHKRAQRFFDAVGGKIQKSECLEKINGTRNKDYCLIYSLIPVKDRADLLERYEVLSEFIRQSKSFGAQRQLSERRTVDIAFENLARSAGYSDPNVFIFEMESETPSDIYRDYAVGDITLTPYIDVKAFKVSYAVRKDGKTISSVPSKYGKDKTVVEIRDNIRSLNKKFRRIKTSFENCMNGRVGFTAEQIGKMSRERLIKTVLEKLLFITADGKLAVYANGMFADTDGNEVCPETVIIAHAAELKKLGLLQTAIAYLVRNNIVQPFKQVLREIYTKTEQEQEQTDMLRFKGFNIDLKKCVAALKGKGWGVSEDIGLRKVYYKTDTVAAAFREFDFFYIADYENINREFECVLFLDRKTYEVKPLKDVDDITFSETLRDVDLMISISANVVYDFELAMSTVEIRKEVLRSIVDILGLANVSFLKDNIKVEGAYGTYVINIRTGLVFKEGKGNLLLDTVYSTDKVLPLDFADEDPMTADIISKAVVLSDDKNIKDPSILNEIK